MPASEVRSAISSAVLRRASVFRSSVIIVLAVLVSAAFSAVLGYHASANVLRSYVQVEIASDPSPSTVPVLSAKSK